MADQFADALANIRFPRFDAGMLKMSEEMKAKQENVHSINHLAEISKASTAREFCARIDAQMKKFDEALDQAHEIGMTLVTFGPSITIHVTGLGFHNPSLIFFYGVTEDGNEVQLVQHVSQINFVLVKLPRLHPDEPKRPFGFEQGVPSSEATI